MGSLKYRQLEIDGANGEFHKTTCPEFRPSLPPGLCGCALVTCLRYQTIAFPAVTASRAATLQPDTRGPAALKGWPSLEKLVHDSGRQAPSSGTGFAAVDWTGFPVRGCTGLGPYHTGNRYGKWPFLALFSLKLFDGVPEVPEVPVSPDKRAMSISMMYVRFWPIVRLTLFLSWLGSRT